MLLFIDKVTTGIQRLGLFQWNVSSQVDAHGIRSLGRLIFGLEGASGVLYIFDITNFFDHDKSSFISQLIKLVNQEIFKRDYSCILKEQQLLCLIYCNHLMCSLLFLSYT